MSDDNETLGMTVPLDADGFLRRECPTCEREFKWLPSDSDHDDADPAPDGGYFCPYCSIHAPGDQWFTQAQIEFAQNMVAREIVGPMLQKLNRDLDSTSRRSGGFLSISAKYKKPDEIPPLTEVDDMRRVDFRCHPNEPLKVLDDWDGPIHCLVCGDLA